MLYIHTTLKSKLSLRKSSLFIAFLSCSSGRSALREAYIKINGEKNLIPTNRDIILRNMTQKRKEMREEEKNNKFRLQREMLVLKQYPAAYIVQGEAKPEGGAYICKPGEIFPFPGDFSPSATKTVTAAMYYNKWMLFQS